jgi:hypothetical protein
MSQAAEPRLILGAAPSNGGVRMPDDFYVDGNVFSELLRNPPSVRPSGWNLQTHDVPRIRRGEYWEVGNESRKLIRFYLDGSLVVAASAGQDFLGWRRAEKPNTLHALAAVEFIYEFAELYRRLLAEMLRLGVSLRSCRYKVSMTQLDKESEPLKLKLYPVGAYGWGLATDLGEYQINRAFHEELTAQNLTQDIYDSRYLAYKLIRILFLQFNLTSDKIPYTKKDDRDARYVDIDKIREIA